MQGSEQLDHKRSGCFLILAELDRRRILTSLSRGGRALIAGPRWLGEAERLVDCWPGAPETARAVESGPAFGPPDRALGPPERAVDRAVLPGVAGGPPGLFAAGRGASMNLE